MLNKVLCLPSHCLVVLDNAKKQQSSPFVTGLFASNLSLIPLNLTVSDVKIPYWDWINLFNQNKIALIRLISSRFSWFQLIHHQIWSIFHLIPWFHRFWESHWRNCSKLDWPPNHSELDPRLTRHDGMQTKQKFSPYWNSLDSFSAPLNDSSNPPMK